VQGVPAHQAGRSQAQADLPALQGEAVSRRVLGLIRGTGCSLKPRIKESWDFTTICLLCSPENEQYGKRRKTCSKQ
jgi:hypothetical protein